jgi:hypothetical protein
MASPTGTTMARLKIAPQRGHAVALAEIMARQAGHDVILVMALPRASLSTAEGATWPACWTRSDRYVLKSIWTLECGLLAAGNYLFLMKPAS